MVQCRMCSQSKQTRELKRPNDHPRMRTRRRKLARESALRRLRNRFRRCEHGGSGDSKRRCDHKSFRKCYHGGSGDASGDARAKVPESGDASFRIGHAYTLLKLRRATVRMRVIGSGGGDSCGGGAHWCCPSRDGRQGLRASSSAIPSVTKSLRAPSSTARTTATSSACRRTCATGRAAASRPRRRRLGLHPLTIWAPNSRELVWEWCMAVTGCRH